MFHAILFLTNIKYRMDRKVQTFDRFTICPFTPELKIVEDIDHPTRKSPMPLSFTHGLIKLTVEPLYIILCKNVGEKITWSSKRNPFPIEKAHLLSSI